MKKTLAVLTGGMLISAASVGLGVVAELPGKAIVDRACSTCHNLSRVEKAKKTEAQWEATLDRMIKKGAKVSKEERAAVLEYLKTLKP